MEICQSASHPVYEDYAEGAEPVREAAKFWVSFYEQAAQIRIPTFEAYGNATQLLISIRIYFRGPTQTWGNRRRSRRPWTRAQSQHCIRRKLFARDQPKCSLLSYERERTTLSYSFFFLFPSSPLKEMNFFLPSGANPSKWNGIVDLGDTPSSSFLATTTPTPTPVHLRCFKDSLSHQGKKPFAPGASASAFAFVDAHAHEHADSSFDGLPPGMSPPVLMSPAHPIRLSFKLGQMVGKKATVRISRDMVADVQARYGRGGVERKSVLVQGLSKATPTSTQVTQGQEGEQGGREGATVLVGLY
ncbi:hypothetical protein GYMLUDRAFT_254757 [Collybiopsis luxurians FD-317 M1]|nr:hypothetical protein GYMLUDRAFT_254757 [Collybiopsis luxurians FD-317 M1]